MKYDYIDNDEKLHAFLEHIKTLGSIAVDFEGEFNLHIYGEHLCLIQIFDGSRYYIIDPRSRTLSREALLEFFASDVEKVWFDAQSDNSLVFKCYGVTINGIYDVRALAKALGFMGNLIALEEEFLGTEPVIDDKKRLQQTNWLKRPLADEQIAYALSDVTYLLSLKKVLWDRVVEAGVEKDALYQLKAACSKPKPSAPWTKLCSPRSLTKAQKEALKEYFIARDCVARRFNVPAFHVLDKHKIIELAKKCPGTLDEVYGIISPIPPRFSSCLKETMKTAFDRLHK